MGTFDFEQGSFVFATFVGAEAGVPHTLQVRVRVRLRVRVRVRFRVRARSNPKS